MVSKKPEIWELERKIEDEIIRKRWDSIDTEFLDECEKHREWYLNFTKKEKHPISYQVKKEIEESERFAPHTILYPNEVSQLYYSPMVWDYYLFCVGCMGFLTGIGLYLATRIISG